MSSAAHGSTPYYFVPHESRHPVMSAIGLFFVILGRRPVDQRRRMGHVLPVLRPGLVVDRFVPVVL